MSLVKTLVTLLIGTAFAWLGGVEGAISIVPLNLQPFAGALIMSVLLYMWDLTWLVNLFPASMQPFMRILCGVSTKESLMPPPKGGVTTIYPAFNEEAGLRPALASGLAQTLPPDRIIVIDDGSTDQTSAIAREMGVEVYYRERKANGDTQGKAAGQKFGLSLVDTEFVILVDGDTILKEDAIEKMLPFFNEKETDAVGGYVLPNNITNIWGVIRQFQYHFGFAVIKSGQNNIGTIFVSSGCFTAFRTKALRTVMRLHSRRLWRKNHPKPAVGLAKLWHGFRAFIRLPKKQRLHAIGLAEDQLYTWILMEMGKMVRKRIKKGRKGQALCGGIRFARDAVCYVDDPKDKRVYSKQQYRWDAGFFHNFEDYNYNLFKIRFLFGVFTNFNLAYALLGPMLEVGALLAVSKYFYDEWYSPWISGLLSVPGRTIAHALVRIGNPELTSMLLSSIPARTVQLYASLITFEVAGVVSLLTGFVVGTAVGLIWIFLFMWIPVMRSAWRMREDKRLWITAIGIFPFMLVHYLDVYLFYSAFWNEAILKKRLNRWDKGHSEEKAPDAPLVAVPA